MHGRGGVGQCLTCGRRLQEQSFTSRQRAHAFVERVGPTSKAFVMDANSGAVVLRNDSRIPINASSYAGEPGRLFVDTYLCVKSSRTPSPVACCVIFFSLLVTWVVKSCEDTVIIVASRSTLKDSRGLGVCSVCGELAVVGNEGTDLILHIRDYPKLTI